MIWLTWRQFRAQAITAVAALAAFAILLAAHRLLSGPRRDPATLPDGMQVVSASHTKVQSTLLVRTSGPVLDPAWTVSEVGLEDLVLAYMKQAARPAPRNGHRRLEVQK